MAILTLDRDSAEKALEVIRNTQEKNSPGVQAEDKRYRKGWEDAFLSIEMEIRNAIREEAVKDASPAQERKAILEKAVKSVCGQREHDYGTPENNFARIARLWGAYTGYPFTAHDVAMLMALLKVGRIAKGSGGMDSYVDLCGYAACAGEIISKGRNEE